MSSPQRVRINYANGKAFEERVLGSALKRSDVAVFTQVYVVPFKDSEQIALANQSEALLAKKAASRERASQKSSVNGVTDASRSPCKDSKDYLVLILDMVRFRHCDGAWEFLDVGEMKNGPKAGFTSNQKEGHPLLQKFGGRVQTKSLQSRTSEYPKHSTCALGGAVSLAEVLPSGILPPFSVRVIKPRTKVQRDENGSKVSGRFASYVAGASADGHTSSSDEEESCRMLQAVLDVGELQFDGVGVHAAGLAEEASVDLNVISLCNRFDTFGL